MDLIVISPFGSYQTGQRITDAKEISRILASEAVAHVVKVAPQAAQQAAPQKSTKSDS